MKSSGKLWQITRTNYGDGAESKLVKKTNFIKI